jgi:hypothetical protein
MAKGGQGVGGVGSRGLFMKLEQGKPERREVAWTGTRLHAALDGFAAGCEMRAVRRPLVVDVRRPGTSVRAPKLAARAERNRTGT